MEEARVCCREELISRVVRDPYVIPTTDVIKCTGAL